MLIVFTFKNFFRKEELEMKRKNSVVIHKIKFLVPLLLILPNFVFAANKTADKVKFPFSVAVGFYLKVIVGIVGGALMTLKFATEIIAAYNNKNSDPNGLGACISKFLTHVFIALIAFGVIEILGIF